MSPKIAFIAVLLLVASHANAWAGDPLSSLRSDDTTVKGNANTVIAPQTFVASAAGTPVSLGASVFLVANGKKYLSAESTGLAHTDATKPEGRSVLTILDEKGNSGQKRQIHFGDWVTFKNFEGKRFLGVKQGPEDGDYIYKLVTTDMVWNFGGTSGSSGAVSVYRPRLPAQKNSGWVFLADIGWGHIDGLPFAGVIFKDNPAVFKKPAFSGRWSNDHIDSDREADIATMNCPSGYDALGMVVFQAWGPDRDQGSVQSARCMSTQFIDYISGWLDAAFGIWQYNGSHSGSKPVTIIDTDVTMAHPLISNASLWTLQAAATTKEPQYWGWNHSQFLNQRFADTFSYYREPGQLFDRDSEPADYHRFRLLDPDSPNNRGPISSYDSVVLVSNYGAKLGYADSSKTEFVYATTATDSSPIKWQIIVNETGGQR